MVTHNRLGNSVRVFASWWLAVVLLGFPPLPATAGASGSKPSPEPIPPDKIHILDHLRANLPKAWSEWKLAGDGMELVHSFLAIRRQIPASAAPTLENARVAQANSIIRLEPEPGATAQGNASHETESAGGPMPLQGNAGDGPTPIPLTRLVEGSQAALEIKLDADGAEVTLIRTAGDTVLLPGQPQEIREHHMTYTCTWSLENPPHLLRSTSLRTPPGSFTGKCSPRSKGHLVDHLMWRLDNQKAGGSGALSRGEPP